MAYSEILKRIVKDSSKTYRELAEKCNIDPSYISKLTNGKIINPSEEMLRKIASECNADAQELVLQAYLDNSPTEIRTFVQSVYNETNNFSPDSKEMLNNSTNNSLANFIINYTNQPIINKDKFYILEKDLYEGLLNKGSVIYFDDSDPIGALYNAKQNDLFMIYDSRDIGTGFIIGQFRVDKRSDSLDVFSIVPLNSDTIPSVFDESQLDLENRFVDITNGELKFKNYKFFDSKYSNETATQEESNSIMRQINTVTIIGKILSITI